MARLSDRRDLTEGVIWRQLLVFFIPTALGGIFQQFYHVIDAVIVGKFLGTGALAAVGGSATNCWFLMLTIRELLYNAAKFSDGKQITFTITKTERSVLFIVEDIGPGIPLSYQQKMYEFFSKEDDLSEGLGLGLPLARRHAINLGGDLTLDSSYTQGCRFMVTMPAS